MLANTLEPGVTTASRPESCVHHWLIEPASGPCSNGTCKRCGVTRDFRNSLESLLWERGLDDDSRSLAA